MPRANSARTATRMASAHKIRLGILFGGRSGEHEVSLTSAASVIAALDPRSFAITAIGITKSGNIATTDEMRGMLPAAMLGRVEPYDALAARNSALRLSSGDRDGPDRNHASLPEIIFPLLHGPFGEDGTIQGLLEIAGLPYIGCGVLASAVGMDKDVMKRLFLHAGLPTLPFLVVRSQDLPAAIPALQPSIEETLGFPVFSKPANLGSSVGVVKIHHAGQLKEGLLFSSQFDGKVIIEKGIEARELECAILGNADPQASGVGEVIPAREFYDYQAKYEDAASRVEIPAQVPEEISEQIRRLAIKAFQCIDGTGLARVDFFLERGNGKVWLNEINTMPGFTPISMYPKLWAAQGLTFEELVGHLVRLGLERHRERSGRRIF